MKPLFFVGSAREDLKRFPEDVKDATGYALYVAQMGEKHPHAKPPHQHHATTFGEDRRNR